MKATGMEIRVWQSPDDMPALRKLWISCWYKENWYMIKRSYNLFFSLVLCIGSLSSCSCFPGSGNEVNVVEPKAQRIRLRERR